MAFHPLREALGRAGLRASRHESTFQPRVDAALARFRAIREELERQVRHGDLTPKTARAKAADAAGELKATLGAQAAEHSDAPRAFLDRLIEADGARKRAREHSSTEALQRETNRLLRQALVEQQLVTRASEFAGRTSVRSMSGGKPAPTLASLLALHETATQAGDEAAREWARRQLEAIRPLAPDDADQRRIDLACDRPESVNARTVGKYVEALEGADAEALEQFVGEAIEGRDANACVAAFLMARSNPAGSDARWARMVLNGLGNFPDAAISALRAAEAEARADEVEAACSHADFAAAQAQAQAKLSGLEAPSDGELARQARARDLPVAQPGESIGLSLQRRGSSPEPRPDPADRPD